MVPQGDGVTVCSHSIYYVSLTRLAGPTLVFLTLLLPFLRVHELPDAPYIYVIWAAVITNIAAFSTYSWIQIKQKEAEANKKALEMKLQQTEEDPESDSESP